MTPYQFIDKAVSLPPLNPTIVDLIEDRAEYYLRFWFEKGESIGAQ